MLLLCSILTKATSLWSDLDYEICGGVLHQALDESCCLMMMILWIIIEQLLRERSLLFFILRGRDEHYLGGWMLDGIESS